MTNKNEREVPPPPHTWVNCPNCSKRLFRHDPAKKFNIECNCDGCKAIWQIYDIGEGVNTRLVREPKFNYKPRITKESE